MIHQPGHVTPTVFLSSTIYDLANARTAIAKHLRSLYGIRVLASERRDFPASRGLHSYDNCLRQIRSCDLFILLIDGRYGGLYGPKEDGVSITRRELREAKTLKKTIWTFVNKNLIEERRLFRLFQKSRTPAQGEAKAFQEFQVQQGPTLAKTHLVYEFLEEQTRLPQDNWRWEYSNESDIIKTIDEQLPRFIVDKNPQRIIFPCEDALLFIPSAIADFDIHQSPRYLNTNIRSLNAQNKLTAGLSPETAPALVELLRCIDRTMDLYTADMAVALEGIYREGKGTFYATDSTAEQMEPDSWLRNEYLRRVLRTSEKLRSLSGVRFEYIRFVIILDPLRIETDRTWQRTLDYIVHFHHNLGIQLGFIDSALLPDVNRRLLNSFVIPGHAASINDPDTGFILDYKDPQEIAVLTARCEEMRELCDSEIGAFWLEPRMQTPDVARAIASLARPEMNKSRY